MMIRILTPSTTQKAPQDLYGHEANMNVKCSKSKYSAELKEVEAKEKEVKSQKMNPPKEVKLTSIKHVNYSSSWN